MQYVRVFQISTVTNTLPQTTSNADDNSFLDG